MRTPPPKDANHGNFRFTDIPVLAAVGARGVE